MLDAHMLYRKVGRLLRRTAQQGSERWPSVSWPLGNLVDNAIARQFVSFARVTLPIPLGHRANLCLGIAQVDKPMDFAVPEPHAIVWIESPPKDAELRGRLLDESERAGLPPSWRRSLAGWWAVYAHERLGAFADLASLQQWWLERIDELAAAGLLAIPAAFGPALPDDGLDADTGEQPLG